MLAANRELLDWLRDARGHGAAVEGVEGLFAETLGAGGPAVQVVAEAVAGGRGRASRPRHGGRTAAQEVVAGG